jgi:hypothetical protein
MNSRIEALSREPGARCDHKSRREIRLRWPYPEARIVRARLISETGTRFDVSPLYEIDGGWAITICRECAKTPAVSLALAIFLLILAVASRSRWQYRGPRAPAQ